MQAEPACMTCKHFDGRTLTCKAFPEGIPDEIISGMSPHTVPTKYQRNEVVFLEDPVAVKALSVVSPKD